MPAPKRAGILYEVSSIPLVVAFRPSEQYANKDQCHRLANHPILSAVIQNESKDDTSYKNHNNYRPKDQPSERSDMYFSSSHDQMCVCVCCQMQTTAFRGKGILSFRIINTLSMIIFPQSSRGPVLPTLVAKTCFQPTKTTLRFPAAGRFGPFSRDLSGKNMLPAA